MARLSDTVNRLSDAKGIGPIAGEGVPDVVLFSVIQAGGCEPSPAGWRGLA